MFQMILRYRRDFATCLFFATIFVGLIAPIPSAASDKTTNGPCVKFLAASFESLPPDRLIVIRSDDNKNQSLLWDLFGIQRNKKKIQQISILRPDSPEATIMPLPSLDLQSPNPEIKVLQTDNGGSVVQVVDQGRANHYVGFSPTGKMLWSHSTPASTSTRYDSRADRVVTAKILLDRLIVEVLSEEGEDLLTIRVTDIKNGLTYRTLTEKPRGLGGFFRPVTLVEPTHLYVRTTRGEKTEFWLGFALSPLYDEALNRMVTNVLTRAVDFPEVSTLIKNVIEPEILTEESRRAWVAEAEGRALERKIQAPKL